MAGGMEVARVVTRCNQAKEDEHLDLSECSLTQIPDAVFLLMKHTTLQSFNLSANLIPRIPAKLPVKFPELSALNLSKNHLSNLPDELGQLKSLQSLDLSHNQFSVLPPAVYSLDNLTRLSAQDNLIQDVDVQRLRGLPHIAEVNFRDNPLSFNTYSQLVTVSEVLTVYVTVQDPEFDAVD